MRVKIGNQWFECSPSQPIMIELTEADKRNISNMAPDATKYAQFDDGAPMSKDEMLSWMDAE